MVNRKDMEILRELAKRLNEIASLPVQEEKRSLWRSLNKLEPKRPMVMIDQVCWNEMNIDDELTLQCKDDECRNYEYAMKRTLFQWNHFPVDMVVEPYVQVSKAIGNTGFGISVEQDIAVTDTTSSVVGHKYNNQFQAEEDLQKIKIPQITHDQEETERRLTVAHEIFDDFIDIQLCGISPYLSLWDPISTWMGVENVLYTIIDKPDYMHRLVGRVTEGYLKMLDQLEEQGLLCEPQNLIHCTGAYTDELPAPGYNSEKPRTKDIWMFGLAQMFSTVSPDMFKEFEVDYAGHICERFGLVYYGCCDPLDQKMNEVRMIPNVRKISMSPWTNEECGAENIGRDFVYSRKPNPALLAFDMFDPELVRKEQQTTRQICEKYNCPLEFILKDISTVRYQPERLFQWAEIAMQVAEA